jgi:hypothetical protein
MVPEDIPVYTHSARSAAPAAVVPAAGGEFRCSVAGSAGNGIEMMRKQHQN